MKQTFVNILPGIFLAFDFRRFCVAWSFGVSIHATTANDLRHRRIFHPRLYTLHLFSYNNSWERASSLPSEYSVLNKGTICLYVWWIELSMSALQNTISSEPWIGQHAEMVWGMFLPVDHIPRYTSMTFTIKCSVCSMATVVVVEFQKWHFYVLYNSRYMIRMNRYHCVSIVLVISWNIYTYLMSRTNLYLCWNSC